MHTFLEVFNTIFCSNCLTWILHRRCSDAVLCYVNSITKVEQRYRVNSCGDTARSIKVIPKQPPSSSGAIFKYRLIRWRKTNYFHDLDSLWNCYAPLDVIPDPGLAPDPVSQNDSLPPFGYVLRSAPDPVSRNDSFPPFGYVWRFSFLSRRDSWYKINSWSKIISQAQMIHLHSLIVLKIFISIETWPIWRDI